MTIMAKNYQIKHLNVPAVVQKHFNAGMMDKNVQMLIWWPKMIDFWKWLWRPKTFACTCDVQTQSNQMFLCASNGQKILNWMFECSYDAPMMTNNVQIRCLNMHVMPRNDQIELLNLPTMAKNVWSISEVPTRVKNIQNKAFNTYNGQKHSHMPLRVTFKAQKIFECSCDYSKNN